MRRYRPAISVVLFVLVGLLVPISALSIWASNTIYDSDTFSQRAVEVLDSEVARKELAARLTEQLALAGNQQAVNFRPAFQFAVEVATDTDTFRAIFRNAVKRVHESVLAGRNTDVGLDLSDSLGIITNTVELRSDAGAASATGSGASGGLAGTLSNVTKRLGELRIWSLEEIVGGIALVTGLLAIALAAAGIAVALDRRQAVVRLGFALALGGALLLLLRFGAGLAVTRQISDSQLSDAVGAALSRTTDDLKMVGLWLIGYGVVVAAAASRVRLTPATIGARLDGWAGRRRNSRKGTVALAALLVLGGLLITTNPWFWVQLAAYAFGLWLVYLGAWELVNLVRAKEPASAEAAASPVGSERRRLVIAGASIVAVLAVVTAGFVLVTRRASVQAAASGEQLCNGDTDLCDVPLDEVVFPGTHNSMSSSLYPGWLFGEHVRTIKQQLQAGVRALLIDTHYGVPTTVRLPGSDSQLIVTDLSAELAAPQGERVDPAVQARAEALAARASPGANARRDIYLCHNFCEMGAITFASALRDVRDFLDANPDEVVTLIIQDATSPAETAAAIEAAGLADRAATLRKGEDLPTLAKLIDDGTRLLVFAEQGGDGAPDWYMKAYDWFQETPYSFKTTDDFSCKPNRGEPDNPLFLVNHWVEAAPPNPSAAAKANGSDLLSKRLEACSEERGLIPNVVAVDFSEKGDMIGVVDDLDRALRHLVAGLGDDATTTSVAPASSTTAVATTVPPTTSTTLAGPTTTVPPHTVVTDLSGGNPTAFCAVALETLRGVQAWGIASITAAPGERGAVELTFAPYLSRMMGAYRASAPTRLAELAAPFQDRMDRAMVELRKIVPDEAKLNGFADSVATQLASPDSPDAVTVQLAVQQLIEADAGAAEFNAAADRLEQADAGGELIVDFGTVPDGVAESAGYGCINETFTVVG